MLMKTYLITVVNLLLLVPGLWAQAGDDERQAYIDRYSALAVIEMERTGVPASIKLAQAVLESRWGTSVLARQANNHFGIKCGGHWTGETFYRKDDDYVRGKLVPSCFRAYSSTYESFVAHSNFLISNSRYAGLFALKRTNYKGWAKGLKNAGYATAKHYHKSLINIIEELELYRYDRMSSSDPVFADHQPQIDPKPSGTITRPGEVPITPPFAQPQAPSREEVKTLEILSNNDVKYVIPLEGTTLEKLSKELNIPVKWLLSYNENIDKITQELNPGEWIYLQAKRKNYRGRQRWHEVTSHDNMFDISQRYGISLRHLYERNQMIPGSEPAAGTRIKIRGGQVKKTPALRAIQGLGSGRSPVPTMRKKTKPVSQPTAKVNFSNFIQDNGTQNQPQPDKVSSGAVYHKVAFGETVESIARKYQTNVKQLRDWNGLGENERVQVGIRLRVQ